MRKGLTVVLYEDVNLASKRTDPSNMMKKIVYMPFAAVKTSVDFLCIERGNR